MAAVLASAYFLPAAAIGTSSTQVLATCVTNPARFVFAQIWRAAFARHGQFSGPGARYTSRQGLNEAF